jgi:phage/plasmid-like protein (TIGR03299 family)
MPAFAITDNLDWTVSNRPVASMNFQGEWVVDPMTKAVHRDDTDTRIGYVSANYETVQNSDLLDIIDPMVKEEVLTIENMGYLSHGSKVFIQAKINEEFRVVGETYKAYVTILNGHTGNASVAIGTSNVRVICGNTFSMAYKDLSERFRHSQGVNERILETTAVTNYVSESMRAYSAAADKLASTHMSIDQFRGFLETLYKRDINKMNNVETYSSLFRSGTGGGNQGNTLYDAFNAITDFGSNHSRKSEDGRLVYSNFGSGSKANSRAMAILMEMAS